MTEITLPKPGMASADQFRKLSEIATLIYEGHDLQDVLIRLTEGVCRHSSWAISSIQVLDLERHRTMPIVRYDPYRPKNGHHYPMEWDVSGSPLRRIVETGQPMILADAAAQETYVGFRDDARQRGYHTVVMIPLQFPDEQGRSIVFTVISNEIVEVDATEMGFLRCLADLADIAVRRMQILRQEMRETERLREITCNMTAALATTLDPDNASDLYGGLSRLFPTGWFAIDLTTGRILYDPAAESPLPRFLARRLPDSVIRTALNVDSNHNDRSVRLYVERETHSALMQGLVIDGTRVGALFLLDIEGLSANEQIAAQAGQLALSTLILRNYMAFKTREHITRRLLKRLFAGDLRDESDLREEAGLLGFELDRSVWLVGIRSGSRESLKEDVHSFIQRSAQNSFGQVLSYMLGNEIYFIIHDGDEIRDQKMRDMFLQRIQPVIPGAVAVLSDQIDRLSDIPQAYDSCRWNLQVAESMRAKNWITRRKVGSFPSLMASVSDRITDEFLSETIAPIAKADSARGKTALRTLETYLASGRRPQETADILGIHVSTLRYRLERISEIHGLDLTDPERCFELELAIRLHRLRSSYQK